MSSLEEALAPYDYPFSEELIGQKPASPRDSAKLLVWDEENDREVLTTVRQLGEYLPKGTVLVLNDTKVIPARLPLFRSTGGKVEALFTVTEGAQLKALLNRRVPEGEILHLNKTYRFKVVRAEEKEWIIEPLFPAKKFDAVLMKYGEAPLPPYIKHSPLTLKQQRERYQSVFAKTKGSIAAPTASLHFTPRLLTALQKQGVTIVHVTLHVHLGTFLPLTEEHLKSGKLHSEWYTVPTKTARALEKAKKQGLPIIPVGTTALRTVESSCDAKGMIVRPSGWTQLFIREGYKFRLATGLFTNFHVPKSSLLMLVCALAGREKVLHLYARAMKEKMRFFSFGDAMLLLPKHQQ